MSKLKVILESLEAAKKDANTSLDEIPFKLRPGWAMRIAAAKDNMTELTKEYRRELSNMIKKKYFMIGNLEDISTFVSRLGELEVDGLAVDVSAFYRRVADKLAPTIGMRGEFGVTQCKIMNSVVGDVAVENPEMEIKDATPNVVPEIRSYDVLLDHVRRCIRTTNGDKVSAELTNKRIVNQALTLEWDAPTSLYVKGATEDEILYLSTALVGGPAVVLNIPPNPTLEWAREQLGLKDDIKTSKPQPQPKPSKNLTVAVQQKIEK